MITGWGSALPDRVVTNDDLSKTLDTSDEWISERSGIRERHIGGSTAELSIRSGAEALAMAGGEGLKGKPVKLIERALKVDPKNGHALFLAGAAAMEAGDAKRGVTYWEALLPLVEPDSELDKMLREGIEKMKAAAAK